MSLSPSQELLSIRDLIRYGVSRFNSSQLSFGHGTDNAWDEAAYLLLHALHLPLDTLDPFLDARLLQAEREAVLRLFERRLQERLPAPYLTHEAWLRGRRFYVDQRVIVPRSPIAELLEDGLSPWISDPHAIENILDMCTGSGCLAILSALAFSKARVDGVDLSKDALEVAQRNVETYQLQDRVFLHNHNLFEALAPRLYDLILCNPPYVNSAAMTALPPEYQHEPPQALAGGQDGMDVVRRVLKEAAAFMAPHGMLVMEIGHERPYFEAAFPDLQPIWLDTNATSDQILLLSREQLVS
jgi:ribosomal protein L3 glutamine methyltransferase